MEQCLEISSKTGCGQRLFLSGIEYNVQSSVADFVFFIKMLCSLVSLRSVTAS